jgi:outer membrane protein TolC
VLIYDRTILGALGEVADALAAAASTTSALESQQRLELASRQYLELARLQFANGVVAYLDVLDAQRQLFSAELELSTATRDRLLAVVELYRALGGGWAAADEITGSASNPVER